MEIKNCRECKRLFNYIGGGYILCPECMAKLDEKFKLVKEYINKNPGAGMAEIATNNDVSTNQIERWIREERLVFADDSPIAIQCEKCGVNIKSGRFCNKCKEGLANGLAYTNTPAAEPRRQEREKARMRFLGE